MAITKFEDKLIGVEKESTAVILGAGGTLLQYREQVIELIDQSDAFTIGINNITSFMVPDYHLWTNNGRLRKFHGCICPESNLIIGWGILHKLLQELRIKDYIEVAYTDKEGVSYGYANGQILGFYRTAGCLAIMIAHLMGASEIVIAGMDGYSYIDTGNVTGQHYYGIGMTDENSPEICKEKDRLVRKVLRGLRKYGIKFSIITPTVFKEFYNKTVIQK